MSDALEGDWEELECKARLERRGSMMHPNGIAQDPIRPLEEAVNEARRLVRKMNPSNPASVSAAHEAIVLMGDAMVAAFRVSEGRRVRLDP